MELHSLDHRLDLSTDTYVEPFTYPYPKEESDKVKETVKDFGNYLTLNNQARHILNVLIQQIGTPANNDPINLICVDEILLRLYNLKIKDMDSFQDAVLEIQLLEMMSGMCPQGRSIRLLQVLYSSKF